MQKWRQRLCGCLAGLFAIGLSVLGVAPTAYAAASTYERPDLTRETSLQIHYHQGNVDFDNVEFQVYKVADMTEMVRFEFVDRFDAYPVYFKDEMTASDWMNLADTMAGYVSRDNLRPDYIGTTDKWGLLTLNDMDASLYLVLADTHQREYLTTENGQSVLHKVYYQMAPFLVATPSLERNTWYYNVEVSPKFTASEEATMSKRVLKVWDDAGYETQRPGALVFDLVRGNQIYDTVELSSENFWRYQWDGLDNSYNWRIVEHTAGNYRVSTRQEGMTTVVTNRYNYPVDDNTSTDEPTLPTPPAMDIPDDDTPLTGLPDLPNETPDTPNTTTTTMTTTPSDDLTDIPDEKPPMVSLPQTGQLWWPVPVLAAGGCVLFLAGMLLRWKGRGRREDI